MSVDPDGNRIAQLVKEMSDSIANLGPVKKV
jgi:hypothetical protein